MRFVNISRFPDYLCPMKKLFFLLVALAASLGVQAQWGCPDPQATNYSASATQNNGSCLYLPTNYTMPVRATLDILVYEISGLVYWNGKLYGHGDSGNPNRLYELDTTTGAITKKIILGTKANIDWEDITQSNTHFFVADVGNNLGTRQDLVVYKFPKALLNSPDSVLTIPDNQIESLFFSWEDQTTFSSNSNTPFDCEAIAWRNNKLHLFTKNHLNNGPCVHYTIPDTAGTYQAKKRDSLNTGNMMITAADFAANKQLMLTGYNIISGEIVLWYIYDFSSDDSCFIMGNKRKINVGTFSTNGQVEGICFTDTTGGFACNEKFITVAPARLYRFKTTPWYPYVYPNGIGEISDNAAAGYTWNGQQIELLTPGRLQVYTLNGQLVGSASNVGLPLPVTPGVYIIQWQEAGKKVQREKRMLR